MKSLFEKEENEIALNQVKVDLISRYYPFTKEELIIYKDVLNFDRYNLMTNVHITWDYELIQILKDKIDWSALWKLKIVNLNYEFFKKFKDEIFLGPIGLSKNILWCDNILNNYGDRFDWSGGLILNDSLSTIENLRRFKEKLNWDLVSNWICIDFNRDVIEEFADKWNWKKLSANKHLPLTVDFVIKYLDKLDFDELSRNPSCISLIYQNPSSKRWNWFKVASNPGITYNDESFNFVYENFKKQNETNLIFSPLSKKFELTSFIKNVIMNNNNITYFLRDEFIPYLPWSDICKHNAIKLPLEFIETNKNKLNFKEHAFLKTHKDVFTKEFILENLNLFNLEHYSFFSLPLTIEWIESSSSKIDWTQVSRNENIDWTWEFIENNFHKLSFSGLCTNKGIFNKLIYDGAAKNEIPAVLEIQKNNFKTIKL